MKKTGVRAAAAVLLCLAVVLPGCAKDEREDSAGQSSAKSSQLAKSSQAAAATELIPRQVLFGNPDRHVALTRHELRVDRMNVKVDAEANESNRAITLAELRVGERSQAVIAFVRCPRSEMPAQVDLLAQAERFL